MQTAAATSTVLQEKFPPPQVCDRCESDRKRPSLHDIQAAANPNKAENMHNLLFKDEDEERLLLSCHTTQP